MMYPSHPQMMMVNGAPMMMSHPQMSFPIMSPNGQMVSLQPNAMFPGAMQMAVPFGFNGGTPMTFPLGSPPPGTVVMHPGNPAATVINPATAPPKK